MAHIKVNAILFDMDGVLVEAKSWHFDALNQSLEYFGYQSISHDDHLNNYDGLPTAIKLKKHPETKNLSENIHCDINHKKQELTSQIFKQKCTPNFAILELCQKLKNKIKIAVCSNSIRKTMEIALDNLGLMPHIEFFLSNQDVKNSKPDPEIYLTAIKRLALNPSDVLILEDNENGLKAAYESGAHVLKINSVSEVNYKNIMNTICEIESTS